MNLRFVVPVLALNAIPSSGAAAQSDVAFPVSVYAERRARLAADLAPSPVIVPGHYMIRNSGRDKQDPNFWYLTGVESPYALLFILPGAPRPRSVLFLPDAFEFAGAQFPHPDPRFRRAPWNHPIRRLAPGPESAQSTGIDATYPLSSFSERLPELVGTAREVYFVRAESNLYAPPGLDRPLSTREQLERAIADRLPGRTIQDGTPFVERMRVVKDRHEIAALRRAAEISVEGMVEAMRVIEPGLNDRDVAAAMEYVWARNGSPRNAFGRIVSSGAGAISLYTLKSENYNSTDRVMRDGELVFIDYGAAEFQTYGSDVCRTFPVSGRFTDEQRRLYEIALEAQEAALATIRPGVMMIDVIRAAARVFRAHGLEQYEDIERMGVERVWGVMPSPTYWLAEGSTLTNYSGARGTGVRDLGHHVGIEASDGRDYSQPLAPGMVFTVEPKLYVPESNLAIMIEDVVVVTADGYDNLSAGAPRSVAEIERIMAEPPTYVRR